MGRARTEPPAAGAPDTTPPADGDTYEKDRLFVELEQRVVELEQQLAEKDAALQAGHDELANANQRAAEAADRADKAEAELGETKAAADLHVQAREDELVELEYRGGAITLGAPDVSPSGDVIATDEDVYGSTDPWNGGKPIEARKGDVVKVSPRKAEQLLEDFPDSFREV